MNPETAAATIASLHSIKRKQQRRIINESLLASYSDDVRQLIAPLVGLEDGDGNATSVMDALELVAVKIGWMLVREGV